MVDKVRQVLSGWLVPISIVIIVVAWHLAHILPGGAYWLQVDRVTAFDAPHEAAVVMEVDRTIHRPFTADWRVLVRHWTGGGWEIVCMADGGGDYRPDAALPSPLTLEWWTNGQCPYPPAGQIMVSTIWTIDTAFPGNRTVVAESNIFNVMESTK